MARIAPFGIFLALTFCQNEFGEAGRFWFYLAKVVVGAGLIGFVRAAIPEMRWQVSWQAIAVGAGVFALWVGLDGLYPSQDEVVHNYLCPALNKLGLESWCPKASVVKAWNPHLQFGSGSALAWMFVLVRVFGSSLVVPPLEEVFFRSFLYRYLVKADFQRVPLGKFFAGPFVITSVLFGLEHREWLAGILCGFAYQGLVCWKKRLGDAISAHALTNLLLGLWVIWKGAWHFW
jgi:membrane protease YdiL (CAAX protease family)